MNLARIAPGLARVLLAAATCACLAPRAGVAEVSVESLDPGDHGFVLMAPGDNPFPWPDFALVRRHLPAAQVLDPNGSERGDGRPAFAIDPLTGAPGVVWAWFDGDDLEIASSSWRDGAWSAWRILTAAAEDDLDPVVAFGPDGTRRLVW